jgi:geranylgeranylglycerol-phosphate geranylgeranyltransferase
MMGFSILIGVLISGGFDGVTPQELFLAFITGFTLTGGAMVINDYFDKGIDAVNEPNRPIPSGLVKPGEAIIFTCLLSIIGLTGAWLTSIGAFIIALFAWSVMMLYSAWGKRTGFIGNIMVSTCIALPFIYGGFLTGRLESSLPFSILAFLSNTGREVTKGIMDIEGDRVEGVKTIAVTYGEKVAAYVASTFYVMAVAISATPVILKLVSIFYVPFVVVTDLGLLYGSISLLRNHNRDNARRVKTQVLIWMVFGLLAFGAGSLKI